MAASPVYASAPRNAAVTLNNASSTTVIDIPLTPPSAGCRIKEIRVHSGPTTAPGTPTCSILFNDGVNSFILDVIALTSTVNLLQAVFTYPNLILATGQTLKARMSAAITSGGSIDIVVQGEDLT